MKSRVIPDAGPNHSNDPYCQARAWKDTPPAIRDSKCGTRREITELKFEQVTCRKARLPKAFVIN